MDGSVWNLRFLFVPSVFSLFFIPTHTLNPPTPDSLLASPCGDANSESAGGLTGTAPLPLTPTHSHSLTLLSLPPSTTYPQLSPFTKPRRRNATDAVTYMIIIYLLLVIILNQLIYVTCLCSLCSICFFHFRRPHSHLLALALSPPSPTLSARVLAPVTTLDPLLKEEKTDFKLYTQWPMIYGAETKTFSIRISVTADQEAEIPPIFKSCNNTCHNTHNNSSTLTQNALVFTEYIAILCYEFDKLNLCRKHSLPALIPLVVRYILVLVPAAQLRLTLTYSPISYLFTLAWWCPRNHQGASRAQILLLQAPGDPIVLQSLKNG